MNPPFNRKVALFDTAGKLPADQRAAFLREACQTDTGFLRQLEGLLLAGAAAGTFLDKPASRPTDPASSAAHPLRIHPQSGASSALGDGQGSVIGRYKLLQHKYKNLKSPQYPSVSEFVTSK